MVTSTQCRVPVVKDFANKMVSTLSTASMLSTVRQTANLAATTVMELLQVVAQCQALTFSPTGERVLLEYVSAHPNGPITTLHGRGGVVGDTLGNVLQTTGTTVTREFYVNDATSSRQMLQFARAVLNRYRQMFGQESWMGSGSGANDVEGYPDEYVTRTAQHLIEAVGDRFAGISDEMAMARLPMLISELIQKEQQEALAALNVTFDNWFSENALLQQGAVNRILERLRTAGHTYEQGNGLWLRSTTFGDEADRVLVRADGSPTYLAGDIAYHANKFDRGYSRLVDVWASDHAGYIERTRSGLAALGYDPMRLTILLVAPVRLLRDGTEVKASRLDGLIEVVTLAELLTELDVDEVRWAFASAPPTLSLDIDADRMRRQDSTNPLWNIRYARSICRWAEENNGQAISAPISDQILGFREHAEAAARELEPHAIAAFAQSLAADWTAYIGEGNRPAPVLGSAVGATLDVALHLLGIDLKYENL
jgi:arginyl-tRNA synthetase